MNAEAAPSEGGSVWLWLRPAAVAFLTAVTALFGILLLPDQPPEVNIVQPQIEVYADQPGVKSAVSMTMISGVDVPAATIRPSPPAQPPPIRAPTLKRGYELGLSLRILGHVTKPVRFVMALLYFPPLTGYGVVPLTWPPVRKPSGIAAGSGRQVAQRSATSIAGSYEYLAMATFRPNYHLPYSAPQQIQRSVYFTVTTLQSLGSVSGGSHLRITFPLVYNEAGGTAGQAPVSLLSQGIPSSRLFGTAKYPPPLPGRLYPLDLTPATTKYEPSNGDLSNFQLLSGDPPVLTPYGSWSWTGLSNITVLAQDVVAADVAQQHLFWSGILIGIAGAGAFAFVLELISLGQKLTSSRPRKGAIKPTQGAL